MSCLPQELVDQIILHIADNKDTRSLHATSLVSRSWVDTSRRGLFKLVTIPNETSDVRAQLMCLPRFMFLVTHPNIARYVIKLDVYTLHDPSSYISRHSLGHFTSPRLWQWLLSEHYVSVFSDS
jgi:hypothetical protein